MKSAQSKSLRNDGVLDSPGCLQGDEKYSKSILIWWWLKNLSASFYLLQLWQSGRISKLPSVAPAPFSSWTFGTCQLASPPACDWMMGNARKNTMRALWSVSKTLEPEKKIGRIGRDLFADLQVQNFSFHNSGPPAVLKITLTKLENHLFALWTSRTIRKPPKSFCGLYSVPRYFNSGMIHNTYQ